VLLTAGTLKRGDAIVAGTAWGRVRQMNSVRAIMRLRITYYHPVVTLTAWKFTHVLMCVGW